MKDYRPISADVRTTRRVGSWVTVVHLNGPPERETSTLAQRYVDQNHGVLNLDVEVVVSVFLLGPPAVFSRLCSRCWPRCGAQPPGRTDEAGSGTTR